MLSLEDEFPFESYRSYNYKSELQRRSQGAFERQPEYVLVREEGPDHDRSFTVQATVGGKNLGTGSGPTKAAAEQQAAYDALRSLHIQETETQQRTTDATLPSWLRMRCATEGEEVILRMTGRSLAPKHALSVLIPKGKVRYETVQLRECLATVGGRAKRLVASQQCFRGVSNRGEMTTIVSRLLKGARVAAIADGTPLGVWMRSLASMKDFQTAASSSSLIDSVNALFGALLIEHGLEACAASAQLFFSETHTLDPEACKAAKSRLQAKVQECLRGHGSMLIYEYQALRRPNEAHKAQFLARVRLGGRVLGVAQAGSKKDAAEQASIAALQHPGFSQIMESLRAQTGATQDETTSSNQAGD